MQPSKACSLTGSLQCLRLSLCRILQRLGACDLTEPAGFVGPNPKDWQIVKRLTAWISSMRIKSCRSCSGAASTANVPPKAQPPAADLQSSTAPALPEVIGFLLQKPFGNVGSVILRFPRNTPAAAMERGKFGV